MICTQGRNSLVPVVSNDKAVQRNNRHRRIESKKLPGVNISREGGSDNVSQVRHVVDIGQGRGDQYVALAGDRHPGKNSKEKNESTSALVRGSSTCQ